MARNPLAEVFGYPSSNHSLDSRRYRDQKLCPYNNKTIHCTKVSVDDPLGVCSVQHQQHAVITCPVRFRQDWLIAQHAAEFFFPPATRWERFSEVRLGDEGGKTAGNIDLVLVAHDERHRILDFGALEVQAVYISGNIREPFRAFMAEPTRDFDWTGRPKYPRPDYLSSSRKRLEPQLRYKGSILRSWGKKQAVAIQQSFYNTLPDFDPVPPPEANLLWLMYDLALDTAQNRYTLVLKQRLYTSYEQTLLRITTPHIGTMDTFVSQLQDRLSTRLAGLEAADATKPTAI